MAPSIKPSQLALVAAVAFAIAMALPGAALGAEQTFGSPLTPGPSGLFGCETMPVIEPVNFDYVAGPSPTPDCTWRQSGVFGSLADPRFSSVPGDGVITRVDVLSGANPAPLRFAVFRQLGTGGFAGQCCFFVSESQPVQPAPNTVSSFPVAIPVTRNTLDGIQAIDLLGVSATAGQGSLPIRQVGSTNSFALTANGSVNAGIFYPRIGSVANDIGGGRREEGVPGFELMVRFTWCANDDATCLPAGTAQAALAARAARVQRGRALIRLACNGNAVCEGALALLNPGAAGASASRTTKYGTVRYKIAAGKTATVKLKLNAKGKRLLKRKSKAKVAVRITPTGGAAQTSSLTLKR